MAADVLAKDLRERSVSVLALGLSVAMLTVGVLGIYTGMSDAIDELTRNLPAEVLAFVGGDAPGGYVVGELFHLIAPLALVAYAVLTGASALAGEEENKTLGLLLGVPLRRSRLVAEKAVGLVVGVGSAGGLFLLAAVGASALFGVGLDGWHVVATGVHLVLLAVLFGSVALALGAATGRSGLAAGAVGAVAVAAYLSDSMLPLARLDGWARLSPWYYYTGSDPLVNGLDLPHLGVLAALTGAALLVAVIAFGRRDLRG